MENLLNEALAYAKQGFKVFPLIPKQKRPIKDWSYLKATNDPEKVYNVFCNEEPYNVGINLKEGGLIVLDLDRHTSKQDGVAWLASKTKDSLETDCVVSSPRNGLHIYYSLNGFKVPNKLELADGVEILTDFCTLPPSYIDMPKDNIKGSYKIVSGGFEGIQPIPMWLVKEIQAKQGKSGMTPNFNNVNKPKTFFTAKFMTELMNGTTTGSRNSWITQQYGRMLSLGMSYTVAYEWIRLVNENFIDDPISDSELNKIVLSITKREQRKQSQTERSD